MSLLLRRRMLLNTIQEPVNIFDKSQSIIAGIKNETVVNTYADTIFPSSYIATLFKPNTIYIMSYDIEFVYTTSNYYNNVVGFALVDNSGTYSQRTLYGNDYFPIGTKRSVYYFFSTPENINGGTWRFYVYTGFYYNDEGTRVNGEMIFRNIKIVEAENLFDIDKAELKDCTLIDGKFTALNANCCVDIKLPAGKYYISLKKSSNFAIYLRNGKVTSGYLSTIGASATSTTITFNADKDGYLRISWFNTGESISDVRIYNAE